MIARDLKHIEDVLSLSVTDMAYALGVSRQAIYDWQGAKPVSPENGDRIRRLARAADVFWEAEIPVSPDMLRRAIYNGRSFLDITHDGENAEQAARDLLNIIKVEDAQRKRLSAKMKGRTMPTDFSEAGIPHLTENAVSDPELRPCPFCGDTPAKPELYQDQYGYWVVGHGPCGTHSGTLPANSDHFPNARERIIAAWNRRASP